MNEQTIDRIIRDRTRITPERIAIDEVGRTWTYAELDARSDELARCLSHGDRVSTLTGNSGEHVALMFACAKAGAILHPISWRLAPAEIAYQLDDAEPAVFLVEDDHRELGEAALALAGVTPALTLEPRSPGAPGSAAFERRSAAPHLHLGHDREAEGRIAHACQLLLDQPLLRSGNRDPPGRRRLAGAAAVSLRRVERPVDPGLVEGRQDRARARLRPGSVAGAGRAEADHVADGRPGELPLHVPGGAIRRRRPQLPEARRRRRSADAGGAARRVGGTGHRDRAGLRAHRGGPERPLSAARGRTAQGGLRGQALPLCRV